MLNETPSSNRRQKWAGNVLLAVIIVIFIAIISPAIIQPQEFAHRLKVAAQAYFPQQQPSSKLAKPGPQSTVDCAGVTSAK